MDRSKKKLSGQNRLAVNFSSTADAAVITASGRYTAQMFQPQLCRIPMSGQNR